MATTPAPAPARAPVPKQPRRSLNRIIPAVPHRFSRPPAARPLTPEDLAPAPPRDTQPSARGAKPEAAPAAVETPLTPDSRVSPVGNRHGDDHALANSPARPDDQRPIDTADAQAGKPERQFVATQSGREPAAAPQPGQPTLFAVNGERPKSTVRTELPPEFHPREKPMGHAFAAEDVHLATQPPLVQATFHRPQPSVDGLVFGGLVQESPAMPSTPQEFDQGARATQHGFGRPPPGLALPHLAPQFYPGHSHHPSEPATPWPQPPYSMAMPDAVYTNGSDYHSPAYPPASGPFQTPFADPFSPQGGPVSMNGGAMRSHSQSPSKSQHGEATPLSNYGEEPQNFVYTNGSSSAKPYTSSEGYDITKHIFSQFGNPEFTDYVLHVRSPDGILWSMPVHAAIVSRSPVIFEALRHSAPPPFQTKDPRRMAEVLTDDMFVTPESLNEAVKILYAAPLLHGEAFLYNLGPYDAVNDHGFAYNDARKRMSQAISYAAAGRVLQIPEMQTCGLQIAKSLLRWDTLDIFLHFGFAVNQTTVQVKGFVTDSRFLETQAVPLLDDALEFIANSFPSNFTLYAIAPELRQTPRLPAVIESHNPSHNPRLSKIRFGDTQPENDHKPSPITQVLSSVLLSLPLALLDRLFSHPAAANQIGWSDLVRIMRSSIEERERRRHKALKSLDQSLESSIPRMLMENLYREERIEPTSERPSGFKLVAVGLPES